MEEDWRLTSVYYSCCCCKEAKRLAEGFDGGGRALGVGMECCLSLWPPSSVDLRAGGSVVMLFHRVAAAAGSDEL